MKLVQFVFACEGHIGHVAAGPRFAGNTFAKVINDDVVEARPARIAAGTRILSREDAVENLDDVQDTDFQGGFLEEFAGDAGL